MIFVNSMFEWGEKTYIIRFRYRKDQDSLLIDDHVTSLPKLIQ